jgi:hypothetical protein
VADEVAEGPAAERGLGEHARRHAIDQLDKRCGRGEKAGVTRRRDERHREAPSV